MLIKPIISRDHLKETLYFIAHINQMISALRWDD